MGGKSDIVKGALDLTAKLLGEGGEQAAKTGIRAYHGSPHDFDRFDMSKIGTGEGAQAYGHGLYAAENERVAKGYRDALTPKNYLLNAPEPEIAAKHGQDVLDMLHYHGGDPNDLQETINRLKEQNKRDLLDLGLSDVSQVKPQNDWGIEANVVNRADRINRLQGLLASPDVKVNPGHMYEVNIAANPEQFLDWDKPLSEQPEAVKTAFQRVDKSINARGDQYTPHELETMGEWYNHFKGKRFNAPQISESLKEVGIPGIKYLDAGSRSAGEGSRNYVVFDDKLISIIRKYGIAGASAMLGYNLMENLDANQALAASMADQDYKASIPNKAYGGYVDDDIDDAIRIAKDVGGSTPVMMEDAKGNKYDAQGNVIPPTNPGPNPARSDVTPETVAAKAVNDPATFDALMERYAVPDRDIAQYEATKKAVAQQPYETQQMTHVGAKPERDVTVDMPLFGGEYSLGKAPYDVAGPMAGMAQTAYDWKTAPFYALPLTAPLAAGMDVAEGVATEDPLTASLAIGFGPGGKYAKAAGIGAVNYLMAPEEAEAGPARWFSKAMEVARELPMNKMTGEQALAMLRKSVSPEELRLTGTDRFLNEQKQVTKQDIINYLDKTRAETSGIRAFHGSPHDFPPVRLIEMPDGTRLYQNMNENPATPEGAKILQEFPLGRFDISKLGTGEGAQAYGHGLYFAGNEDVARGYRDALSPKKVAIGGQMVDSPTFFKAARRSPSVDDNIAMLTKQRENILKEQAQYTSDPELGDFVSELYDQQLKDVDKELAELSQYKGQWFGTRPGGHMYEVNIAADPNQFLDWDKPLSEQPQYIQELLAKHTPLQKNRPYQQSDVGKDIYYKNTQGIGGGDIAAEELKRLGIPGIKYLDAGSRAAGEGTHNYVVFDDRLISIIRKYGIAGASAMLGYNLMEQLTPEQAKAATQADNDYQKLNRAESARFSDFNKGGRVADPVVNKALALTSGY